MYKVHSLKGKTSKQQKKQSLLSLRKKNSAKMESMLLHKKEPHFPTSVETGPHKSLGA